MLWPAWTVSGAVMDTTRPRAEVASAEAMRIDLKDTIVVYVMFAEGWSNLEKYKCVLSHGRES